MVSRSDRWYNKPYREKNCKIGGITIKKKYYAVKKGYKTGIFDTWAQCQAQTKGYKGALFKSFAVREDAEQYLAGGESPAVDEAQDDRYYIYVDGSYSGGVYGWGMAIYYHGKLFDTFFGRGRSEDAAELHNVAGEIEAAMEAARWAQASGEDIVICHDYIGLSEWAEGRWKANKELTKKYAAFMKPYLNQITFKKVSGHTGVPGNEAADQLAKKGAGLL